MRVLSFIPALLLTAASFVAAAPTTGTPSTDVSSCVPAGTPPSSGSGNDAALQPIISIIANATAHITPLSGQLTGLKGSDCTPDNVQGIVVQITAVVSTCVTQLHAAVEVDLTGLDLSNLCITIYGLLTLVCTVLNTLVAIVLLLGKGAVGTVAIVVVNLLHAVTDLVGCLNIFVVASLMGVLGPVIALVCGVVDLLLSIVGGLNILLGVAAA
ncbi:hypothetical protein HYDPIDRAFT_168159 [Hydnomerulius pinastri MD-312]|uniref:Unplaced genomic scaffold scaffold_14, whole genome shotgun sequence n=1 Tax=Hydnomerulius pinastri MD-312 TaxID=994086 RepID=A0A0C9WFB8_9AGAM|nr:hypothetical protein HYDPIDRAFT_168159 [Hydnomerulius pinastri MD-312]